MNVITYTLAYLDRNVTLCAGCTESYSSHTPLGAVQHGAHSGYCDACELLGELDSSRVQQLKQEAASAGDEVTRLACLAYLTGEASAADAMVIDEALAAGEEAATY